VAGLIATGVSLATFGHAGARRRRGRGRDPGLVVERRGADGRGRRRDEEEEYEEPVVKAKRGKAVGAGANPELEEEEEDEYEYEELDPDPEPEAEPSSRVPAVVGAVPRAGRSWQLPKIKLLSATKQLSHDLRQLEVAGQTLVAALEAHGVTTTLLARRWGRR
jgi:hypothetical protein